MTSEDWIKLLGQVLGPLLAATVTGGLLVYQSKRNAQLTVDNHQRELAETRRKELQSARQEWASAYRGALTSCIEAVNSYTGVREGGEPRVKRLIQKSIEYREAYIRAQIATARLFVVEQDEKVRQAAQALTLSLQMEIRNDADIEAVTKRLVSLERGFMAFLDELAGIPSPDSRKVLAMEIVLGSVLAQEVKDRVVAAINQNPPK